jgi:hypothetical protein
VKLEYEIAGHKGLHSPAPDLLRKKQATDIPQGSITADVEVPFKDDRGVEHRTALAITPALSVALEPGEQVLPVTDGKATKVTVRVDSNLTGTAAGKLNLLVPAGWRAEPDNFSVDLATRGDKRDFEFKIFPSNLKEGRAELQAVLHADELRYREGYTLVTREDLGSFYYFQPAVQHVSIVDVKVPKELKDTSWARGTRFRLCFNKSGWM